MFAEVIESLAAAAPERPALHSGVRWYSFGELDHRARTLAGLLYERDVRLGDRIAILALNHLAHFDLMLAAPHLGHIHAPLNHRLTAAELQPLVQRLAPALLLVDAAHEALAATLGVPLLRLSDYEALLAAAASLPPAPRPALTPDDIHMILHTGGSTGVPKGARLPYRQTFGNATDTAAAWQLGADDCAIQCTPCFHAAVNVLSLPLLLVGGRVVLMPRFEAGDYLRLAAEHGVTLLFMVPTMFRALADEPAFARTPLPRLRHAISGGAPCPPALQARYAARGIALRIGYGMTEAGVNCFRLSAEEAQRAPGSVGRPMPNVALALRRADGSLIEAAGEVGEITLAGPQVCAGYYGVDAAAPEAQAFRDGWLWTGDLAQRDADGLYTICGRRKDMYISGGENVHPAEVEAALAQCAGVRECTVFGRPDAHWGECGIALVVAEPGTPADAAALRAELRERLAGYKMPAEILFVPELPRSAAGKILKCAARALYEAGRAVPPATDLSATA